MLRDPHAAEQHLAQRRATCAHPLDAAFGIGQHIADAVAVLEHTFQRRLEDVACQAVVAVGIDGGDAQRRITPELACTLAAEVGHWLVEQRIGVGGRQRREGVQRREGGELLRRVQGQRLQEVPGQRGLAGPARDRVVAATP